MVKEIDNQFKSKLVYAFTGLGKTYCTSLSDKVVDTDDWMCKVLNTNPANLHEIIGYYQKVFPEVLDYKLSYIKDKIKEAKEKEYTILTPSRFFINEIDLAFLPKDVSFSERNVSSRKSNPYTKDLSSALKQITSSLNNKNIPISYIDNYLSSYLFIP